MTNKVVTEVESAAAHAAKVFVYAGVAALVTWGGTTVAGVHAAWALPFIPFVNAGLAYVRKVLQTAAL